MAGRPGGTAAASVLSSETAARERVRPLGRRRARWIIHDRSYGPAAVGVVRRPCRLQGYPRICHTPLPCSSPWLRGRLARCLASTSRRPESTASTMSRCPTRWCSGRGRRRQSWSGLIDPGREIPAGATAVHGITTEQARDEGMPLRRRSAWWPTPSSRPAGAASRGGDEARLRPDHPRHAGRASGPAGIVERGWCGPVLDAVVIDRHFDPDRKGRRTLVDLCALYGIDIGHAHDASADAIASIEVLFALALRHAVLREADLAPPPRDQVAAGTTTGHSYDGWRLSRA